MREGESRGYSVQILLPRAIAFAPDLLLHRLRTWRDEIELLHDGPEQLVFAIQTGDLPLVARIFHTAPEAYATPLCEALTWTPTWHERWDETATRCRVSIVVTVEPQRPINHASLLLAFLAVFDTVLFSLDEVDRDAAILHWIPAQQLLTFERYRRLRIDVGPCGPAVNVRIANATGRPGELLADTIGLSELGLPDLQTVFSNRDPAEVESRLRLYVRSVFVGDRLDCDWVEEAAKAPPLRDALTLQLD